LSNKTSPFKVDEKSAFITWFFLIRLGVLVHVTLKKGRNLIFCRLGSQCVAVNQRSWEGFPTARRLCSPYSPLGILRQACRRHHLLAQPLVEKGGSLRCSTWRLSHETQQAPKRWVSLRLTQPTVSISNLLH